MNVCNLRREKPRRVPLQKTRRGCGRQGRRRGAALIVAGVLALSALYVLGIGPAYRAAYFDRTITVEAFFTAYVPVIRIKDRVPFGSQAMDWKASRDGCKTGWVVRRPP